MRSRFGVLLLFFMVMALISSCGTATPTATVVPATPTVTDTPIPLVPTSTATEPPTETPVPTTTSTAIPCTPDSAFVTDLSLPDGSLVSPGETVSKSWRIENDGDCTWTTDYTWEQIDATGNRFTGVPLGIFLPGPVPPGGRLDISVDIRLDTGATLGEVYTARFQMRSPEGDLFGTHPYARVYAVNGTGECPLATGSLDPFIQLTDRFCFLYPNDHDAYIGIPGDTMVVAPAPSGPGEHVVPYISISNQGNTAGQTVQQWAQQQMTLAMGGGPLPPTSSTTVDGLPAVQTDGLPGLLGNRTIYVIKGNTGFEITVWPVDAGFPDETDDALDLWGIVRSHFTFYEP